MTEISDEMHGLEPPDAAAAGVRRFQVIQGGADAEAEPTPDYPKVIPASSFAGQLVPPRRWHIEECIPGRNVTQFAGDGAAGKSLLLQQLGACTVLGRQWLGLDVKRCPVLYLNAEDEEDELHRRMVSIAQHMDVPIDRFSSLHLWSLAGRSALLGVAAGSSSNINPTPLLDHLDSLIGDLKAGLVILDPLANLFGGNEIVRTHAMQFIALLRGLAIHHSAAVVLASHPSQMGKADGTGSSGSTGWTNACRSRILIERDKGEKGDEDARTLTVNKSNYGRIGKTLRFRWSNGVFILDSDAAAVAARAERDQQDDRLFMELLSKFEGQGIRVSHAPTSTSYGPKLMAGYPPGKGIKIERFKDAMQRLLDTKRIRISEEGPTSKPRPCLRVSS
jgi:RecA-family ATPase